MKKRKFIKKMKTYPPERIVCLTEETVETLYLLGEQERIVGVTGYAVRPKKVRKEKPRVSAFTSADIPRILALCPDLVLAFSDLQAEIAASLIQAGVSVMAYNQRDIAGIFAMIQHLGATVGQDQRALKLVDQYKARLANIRVQTEKRPSLKVYFEEWDDPMISGIKWVSEIIQIAGGIDIFPELQNESLAKNRIIHDPDLVVKRNPDIIIASWCGKKFKKDIMVERYGWKDIDAVINDRNRSMSKNFSIYY